MSGRGKCEGNLHDFMGKFSKGIRPAVAFGPGKSMMIPEYSAASNDEELKLVR